MLLSTVLQIFPISTYANEEEYKIKAISDYQMDKDVLDAKLDEELSTDDQILIDVTVKKNDKDIILVFQKGLELTENSLLPDYMEVDNDYKDSGEYGEAYTSARLKVKKEEVSEDKKEAIEAKTSKEEISLAFDVKDSLKSGELFAAIHDKYVSIVKYVKEKEEPIDTKLEVDKEEVEDNSSDFIADSADTKEDENKSKDEEIPTADPRLLHGEVGYVRFVVQNTSGRGLGWIGFQLRTEENGKEVVVQRDYSKLGTGNLSFTNLKWNTPYKLYMTVVLDSYEKPEDSVAEFYFDKDGIHFTKGGTGIIVRKKGEEQHKLTGEEYYGFTGITGRLKISKEFNQLSGFDAFCFRAEDTFPTWGKEVIYYEQMMSPEKLWTEAQKPRFFEPQKLYNAIRKVIYYCETNKQKLLTDFGLNNPEFYLETKDQEIGFYRVMQQVMCYYSNSIEPEDTKEFSKSSKLHPIVVKAIRHILQESEKVSDEDMESIHLKIYKTFEKSGGKPLQSLLRYEFKRVKKTEIKVLKVSEDDKPLEGAIFELDKLDDDNFSPRYLGDDEDFSEFKFDKLTAGQYRLKELLAPRGYKELVGAIDFEIKEKDGVFSIVLKPGQDPKVFLESDALTIKVKNEKLITDTELTVVKKDKDSEKTLGGAVFEVYEVKERGIQRYSYKDSAGQVIDQWTSSEQDGRFKIIFDREGKFYFKEVKAPKGYKLPAYENVQVDIKDGKVYQSKKVVENEIIVNNEKLKFSIKKVDDKNRLIEKTAKFSLFKKEPDGKEVAVKENVSTNDGVIEFTDIEAGNYLLYEVEAPSGFEKLKEPYEIDMKEDGTISVTHKKKAVKVEKDNAILVVNSPMKFNLPETGGMGRVVIYVAGVVMLFFGVCLGVKKKVGYKK